MLEYTIVDVETTMNCPKGSASHPAYKGNYAPYIGIRTRGWNNIIRCTGLYDEFPEVLKNSPRLWVGHNIKFDLLYLAKMKGWEWFKDLVLWDCQMAEYILSGQKTLYASLDNLATKYGGTLKDDRLKKEFFSKGIGADKIPDSIITPYLANDLINTEVVFKAQLELMWEQGQMDLMQHMSDALLMTTLMQHNGMSVDCAYAQDKYDLLMLQADRYAATYELNLREYLKRTGEEHFFEDLNNTGSPAQLSKVFFGGVIKRKEKELVGKFKNGNDKYKLVDKEYTLRKRIDPEVFKLKPGANGYYPVDEKILKKITGMKTSTGLLPSMAGAILNYREVDKQANTYFKRLLELELDGVVYPSLNHCSTVTGRLSCTEPNLQNQTNGPIKKAFVSRFGDEGVLLDIDYNQLEVVGLAIVSGCSALKNDLNNGVDMHTALFEDMYGRTPTKEERKPFKARSFLTIYGGTANTLAEQCGIDKDDAKRFIDTFYKRYPGVKAWHEQIVNEAKYNGKPTTMFDDGMQVKQYVRVSPTGRRYVFRTYPHEKFDFKTKRKVKEMSFSPTELKNYPIQGFSTGDVVPVVLGKLFHWWANEAPNIRACIKPVVTVHDSIVFDVHQDYLEYALKNIPPIMVNVKEYMKSLDIPDWDVTMKVGISVGKNWLDIKEVSTFSSEELV